MTDIKQLIERLRNNYKWLMRDGFGVSARNIKEAADTLERLTQPVDLVPVAYVTYGSGGGYHYIGKDPEYMTYLGNMIKNEPLYSAETVASLQAQVDAAIKDAGEIREQWIKAQAERDELAKVVQDAAIAALAKIKGRG